MSSQSRIGRIQRATSNEQLLHATGGYEDEAIAAHPGLGEHPGFAKSLIEGKFLSALGYVRRARDRDNDDYLDVIRVLEFAATRALAIMMRPQPAP
jgi:hypothetical protein